MKSLIIALNTFKEAVRDRILYVLLLFALVVIVGAKAIAWISMGEDYKVLKDLGLSSISFFSVIISIFIGTGLIQKEMEKRTIYTILSKPVPKHQFVLGKYFGLLLTLLVNILIMGAVFLGYLWALRVPLDAGLPKAILLIYGEVLIITAVAILFSTVASPILGAIFTFCSYIVGHFSDGIQLLSTQVSSSGMKFICHVLYFLLPNLDYFDVKLRAVHLLEISWVHCVVALLYAVLYSAALLIIAILLFRRKNF